MAKRKRGQPLSAELKRYRSLYAKAKRAGLVRGDKDARSLIPSKYLRTRLNKLEKYLDQTKYTYLDAPYSVREYWRGKENYRVPMTVGRRMIVRADVKEQVKIAKRKLVITRKLKNGQMELIPLPVKAKTYGELIQALENHPYLFEARKYKAENFAFMINGFPSSNLSMKTVQDILDFLSYYQAVEEDRPLDNPSFELYRHKNDWHFPVHYRAQLSNMRRRERQARWRESMTAEQREEFNARRAENRKFQGSYRRQLEKDKQRYQTDEYKAMNRERMRKARAARKAKKND